MRTVIDQARPWFTPSSAFAATTQPQLGATAISSGTGRATAHPTIRSALADPLGEGARAQVRERLGEAERDDEREHRGARLEVEVRFADQRQGRALEPDHRADERVDSDQQRELRGVLAGARAGRPDSSPQRAGERPARLAATISACCGGAGECP